MNIQQRVAAGPFATIAVTGICPIISTDSAVEALFRNSSYIMNALARADIPVLEIAFRKPHEKIANEFENFVRSGEQFGVTVGVGTIVQGHFARQFIGAGAGFVVGHAFMPSVWEVCREYNIPYMPGVKTPTECEIALQAMCDDCPEPFLKFFPAEDSSAGALKKMLEPVRAEHPRVKVVASGFDRPFNKKEWYAQVAAIVYGSGALPDEILERRDWAGLILNLKNLVQEVKEALPPKKPNG